jgi:uncharacterized protein (TIGR04141 family)
VEEYVKGVPELDIELPEADPSQDEGAYNEAAAKQIGGLCLDGKTVGISGPDRIEICDLLAKDGYFIHVKKRSRSSTLSHLFAQGVTSAELLLDDDEFRQEAAKKVAGIGAGFKSAIPKKRGEREKIKVAYVVLSRGQRPDKPYGLPFFSLVSMKTATERLRRAGIEVFAKEIKEA